MGNRNLSSGPSVSPLLPAAMGKKKGIAHVGVNNYNKTSITRLPLRTRAPAMKQRKAPLGKKAQKASDKKAQLAKRAMKQNYGRSGPLKKKGGKGARPGGKSGGKVLLLISHASAYVPHSTITGI